MHDKRFHRPNLWQLWLHLGSVVLTSSINAGSSKAQTINQGQVPNSNAPTAPVVPTPPPQDLRQPTPSSPALPQTPSLPTPTPPELLPSTPSLFPPTQGATEEFPDTIIVKEFKFTCSTVFTPEELAAKVKVTPEWLYKPLSLSRLLQIASDVANLYAEQGYKTSGAKVIVRRTKPQDKLVEVEIRVIEGELEGEIKVKPLGNHRLNSDYVRSRLALAASKPLNVNRLQEALQLLRLNNPLIKSVSAELSAGTEPGKSVLKVEIEEADSFNTEFSINNGRSPSAGSFQRRVALSEGNLLGFGDGLRVGYTNTDGSNAFDIIYTLPLNPRNGTLSFSYTNTSSDVIEPPFDRLDILGNSRTYELTLRQPIIQTIREQTFQEFVLGVTASRRESESSLLDIPYPLSPGADDKGRTRISALRFFQEWTLQNSRQVIALRSQFSLGLDAFGSTINKPLSEVNEVIPDSRFFAWQGQAQWVRLLGKQRGGGTSPLLLVRTNAQLANRSLLPAEQFGLGGFGSVRGYRQDTLLTDNGIFASAELQLPMVRVPQWRGVLQVIPFIDYGTAWNSSGRDNPNPSTLASVGLGLQWRQSDNFIARLDWGIPLVSVNSRDRTWQENGLYFSVQYNPF
jgi:hemolysin activation/secretion protein